MTALNLRKVHHLNTKAMTTLLGLLLVISFLLTACAERVVPVGQEGFRPFVGLWTYPEAVERLGTPSRLIDRGEIFVAVWTRPVQSRAGTIDVRTKTCELLWHSDKFIFRQSNGKLVDLETVDYVTQVPVYCANGNCGSCLDIYRDLNYPCPPLVWSEEKAWPNSAW